MLQLQPARPKGQVTSISLHVLLLSTPQEKRSSYAPPAEEPVRYDGVYRILRCWRKKGIQGFLVCR